VKPADETLLRPVGPAHAAPPPEVPPPHDPEQESLF
jgi:hypothetical protein